MKALRYALAAIAVPALVFGVGFIQEKIFYFFV